MQQDIPNNKQNSWKSRVDDDTAFTEREIMDGNAAWDKLYTRLHQPRRKKQPWYWMAAAGVFIIILFSIYRQQPIPHDESMVVKPAQKTSINTNKLLVQKQKPNAAVVEKNERATTVSVIKDKAVSKKTLTINEPIPLLPDENNEEEMSIIAVQENIQKEDSLPIAFVQPKQKLKVVHVNELGGAAENNAVKKGSDYSTLQFGVNKTKPPTGKIGIQIFTSKTSPN